jgi:hypothetical protein
MSKKYLLLIKSNNAIEVKLNSLDSSNESKEIIARIKDENDEEIFNDLYHSISGDILEAWGVGVSSDAFSIDVFDETEGQADIDNDSPISTYIESQINKISSHEVIDLETPHYGFCEQSFGTVGHIQLLLDDAFDINNLTAISTAFNGNESFVDRFSYKGYKEDMIGMPVDLLSKNSAEDEDDEISIINSDFMELDIKHQLLILKEAD